MLKEKVMVLIAYPVPYPHCQFEGDGVVKICAKSNMATYGEIIGRLPIKAC